jgi:hypothetical protein
MKSGISAADRAFTTDLFDLHAIVLDLGISL